MTADAGTPRVWYVAYASNLALERFRYYLRGGRVAGGRRVYPGCRDPQDPAGSTGLLLPGRLVFAGRSTVWGGGMAFHDRDAPGEIACRGYLVSRAQLADIVAQETREPPGGRFARRIEQRPPSADTPLRTRGAGLYDSLTFLGCHDEIEMVTITHGRVDSMTPTAPTAPYLRWIVAGLRETHGWDLEQVGHYLAGMPGFRDAWTPEALAGL